MRLFHGIHRLCCGLALCYLVGDSPAAAQIVINEFVKEERVANTATLTDTREFVELYNSGNAAVDISGWSISSYRLTGAENSSSLPGGYYATDVIQPGTVIAPGDYFVIGAADIPTVDQVVPFNEIFEDLHATILELRSGADTNAPLVDAVGYDMYRTTLTPPTTTPPTVFAQPSTEQAAQIGGGTWNILHSYNTTETDDFQRLSYARFRDGRDNNNNGRDFGFLPLSPGGSNNLPLNPLHTVPDVDGLNHGDPVTQYNYSFEILTGDNAGPQMVRAIDTQTVDALNPSAIAASPQGGKAMIMWDQSGGGSVAYSKELVNGFELYAYLDSTNLNMPGDWEVEWTAYGIGTSDQQFQTPNPHDSIPGTGSTTVRTQNGATGIGWLFERFQGAPANPINTAKLSLIDFGDGGNSVPGMADTAWDVIATFDLTPSEAGWHKLGVDYDPATGAVTATYGNEVRTFNTVTDLLGTFFVGYREGLTAVPATATASNVDRARPATWDLVVPDLNDADFGNDGDVDGADFLTWQRGVGVGASNSTGDADGNGSVNGADLAIWRSEFGVPAAAAASAAPEPAALGPAVVGFIAVLGRGKPRRKGRNA